MKDVIQYTVASLKTGVKSLKHLYKEAYFRIVLKLIVGIVPVTFLISYGLSFFWANTAKGNLDIPTAILITIAFSLMLGLAGWILIIKVNEDVKELKKASQAKHRSMTLHKNTINKDLYLVKGKKIVLKDKPDYEKTYTRTQIRRAKMEARIIGIELTDKADEVKEIVKDAIDKQIIGTSNADAKKNAKLDQLRFKQNEVTKDLVDIGSLMDKSTKKAIKRTVTTQANVLNPEVAKSMMVNDFDTSYMDKQFEEDLINTFKAFNNDNQIPVFIDGIKVMDTSDNLTHKSTLEIKLRDDKDVTHKFKLDIPKVYDGKFVKVNGSKKIITKQLMMLPIVKAKPTEVWITSNYNKIIMERFGVKNDSLVSYLVKALTPAILDKVLTDRNKVTYKLGNAESVNASYDISSTYMDISKNIVEVTINDYIDSNCTFIFNQQALRKTLEGKDLEDLYSTYYPLGFDNKNSDILYVARNKKDDIYKYNLKTKEVINLHMTLTKFLINKLDVATGGELSKVLSLAVKSNQSATYSRCNIINRNIPTIMMLGLDLGLTRVMEKAGIEYVFEETNKRYSMLDGKAKIKFKDGYLIYDSTKLANTFLLAGLNVLDTSMYSYADMDTPEPYLDYFSETFNSRNVSKGVTNALSLMIDPITKEILEDLGLPTNIYDVLIYANSLLEDLSSYSFNDMNIYRVRGAEQINAIVYKIVAESYKGYKDSYTNRNPMKISVPQDLVLKEVLKASTVDENSDLNPSLELDKMTAVTYRGPSGRNQENTYTNEIRGFDKTMQGVLAVSTPDSNKVGVVRQMAHGSRLSGTRGYIDTSELSTNDMEIYSTLELINPFTSRHADAPRNGMASTQNKHLIPTLTNDLPLISSGVEKTVAYQISDTFAIKAKEDGKVESINLNTGLLIVAYKDRKEVFDISPKMNKNSNGGFYMEQRLNVLVKEGQKFSKGDILAKNDDFFKETHSGDISYVTGKLSKVAIVSGAGTYEDSSMITSTMSSAMASNITMKKTLNLGAKANLQFLVTEGQKIKTGQPLAIFEPEFNDDSINDILDKIGDDYAQEIQELANKVVKSKYTGRVARVDLYYNRPLEDFSPSLRKLITNYKKVNEAKAKVIRDVMGDEASLTAEIPNVEQIVSDKIKGEEVDGILIDIYVEYLDKLSVGDKISFFTALKTVISDVIPSSQAPYSSYRPEEEVEAILSPLSIVSRMVPDVYQMLLGNKVLIELKRQIQEMYND